QRSSAFKFAALYLFTGLLEDKTIFRVSNGEGTVKLSFPLPTGSKHRRDPYRESLGRPGPTDHNHMAYCVMSKARGGMLQAIVSKNRKITGENTPVSQNLT
ncbi:unnamed protein product, partial [Ascophyllum nodosum]